MTMNPPPPIPHEYGRTTDSAKEVATAASTALPPLRRISAPASEAVAGPAATAAVRKPLATSSGLAPPADTTSSAPPITHTAIDLTDMHPISAARTAGGQATPSDGLMDPPTWYTYAGVNIHFNGGRHDTDHPVHRGGLNLWRDVLRRDGDACACRRVRSRCRAGAAGRKT